MAPTCPKQTGHSVVAAPRHFCICIPYVWALVNVWLQLSQDHKEDEDEVAALDALVFSDCCVVVVPIIAAASASVGASSVAASALSC